VASKPYDIFSISICLFILSCIEIVCENFGILVAAHKIRKIAKLLSGPSLAPVPYILSIMFPVALVPLTQFFTYGLNFAHRDFTVRDGFQERNHRELRGFAVLPKGKLIS
jgi:hypothetical protein